MSRTSLDKRDDDVAAQSVALAAVAVPAFGGLRVVIAGGQSARRSRGAAARCIDGDLTVWVALGACDDGEDERY